MGTLIFMTPTEPFNLEIKIAFLAALFVAAPFIMGQVWLFIAPGLYKHERRYALPFIFRPRLCFFAAACSDTFVAFPFAAQFLIDWEKNMGVNRVINAAEYFDLFIMVDGLASPSFLRFLLSFLFLRESDW